MASNIYIYLNQLTDVSVIEVGIKNKKSVFLQFHSHVQGKVMIQNSLLKIVCLRVV